MASVWIAPARDTLVLFRAGSNKNRSEDWASGVNVSNHERAHLSFSVVFRLYVRLSEQALILFLRS